MGDVMKRLLLASLAGLALTSGSALAADMGTPYYKAPPPPPAPVASWTGCYINGGVGYGFWNEDHNTQVLGIPITEASNAAGEGWLGRVGAGCDYQVGSSWVIGVFGDYDFMDLNGNVAGPLVTLNGENEKESAAWAVGGRIGYLVTPALLSYFEGGYTQARFDTVDLLVNVPPSPDSGLDLAARTYSGWFIGGGYEYSLSSILPVSGLFWRTEYRYASYQRQNVPFLADPADISLAPLLTESTRPTVQTITSSLVWKFNFGGPIAARY